MVLHRTHAPSTPDGRYHANRRKALLARLSSACEMCGRTATPSQPLGFMQVDHRLGDGHVRRNGGHSAREITRLLALPTHELHAQVRPLCAPCHKLAPHTTLYRKAAA